MTKTLLFTFIAALALAGSARAQETKAHDHEHGQPAALADQKADDTADHKDMCACCKKDGDDMAAMKDKMKDKMKTMMGKTNDEGKEKK